MNKIISFLVCLLMLASVVSAADEVKPGVLPDSLFYFMDQLFEQIQIVFTQNQTKKVQLRLNIMEERMEELKIMVKEKKYNYINKTTEAVEGQSRLIKIEAKQITKQEKERINARLQNSILVLEKVKMQVPVKAKGGIDNAIAKHRDNIQKFNENSMKTYKTNVEKGKPIEGS